MNKNKIYHIAQPQDLQTGRKSGQYSCASLSGEGFIHCCTQEQLGGVVERYYSDVSGLELLLIDPDALDAELVYENTVGGDELFPHVYGTINMDAVLEVSALQDALG